MYSLHFQPLTRLEKYQSVRLRRGKHRKVGRLVGPLKKRWVRRNEVVVEKQRSIHRADCSHETKKVRKLHVFSLHS